MMAHRLRFPLQLQVVSLTVATWWLLRLAGLGTILLPFLSLAIGIIFVVVWRVWIKHNFSPLKDLPGPKAGHPIFGHVAAIFDAPVGSQIAKWGREISNNGLLYFRGYLGAEYVIVTSIQGASDLLQAHAYDFNKASALRRYVNRFIGHGLNTFEGEKHKALKKLVGPVFIQRRINEFKPVLSNKSQQLVDTLTRSIPVSSPSKQDEYSKGGNQATGLTVDISEFCNRIGLDAACIIGLGLDPNATCDPRTEIFAAYRTIFECDGEKKQQFMWHNSAPAWLVKLWPSPLDHKLDAAYAGVRKVITEIVERRMREEESPLDKPQQRILDLDYLTQVVRSRKFTRDEMVGQMLIVLAAGHETTASTLASSMNKLALLPDVQESIRQELSQLDTMTDREAAENALDNLPFLNGVVWEILRLYPSIPLTMRTCNNDTIIDGHTVPAGTYCFISPAAMNKSPELWGPDADEFNPQRWIQRDEVTGKESIKACGGALSNYCMETFLHGPRGCIGKAMALAEMKRVLSAMVRGFDIRPVDPVMPEFNGFMTVQPMPGHKIRLVPRTKAS